MFETSAETPAVPVGEAEELDPETLTPEERRALGLEEPAEDTEQSETEEAAL